MAMRCRSGKRLPLITVTTNSPVHEEVINVSSPGPIRESDYLSINTYSSGGSGGSSPEGGSSVSSGSELGTELSLYNVPSQVQRGLHPRKGRASPIHLFPGAAGTEDIFPQEPPQSAAAGGPKRQHSMEVDPSYWTVDPATTVEDRFREESELSLADEVAETVPAMFKRMVEKNQDLKALAVPLTDAEEKIDDKELSLSEVLDRVQRHDKGKEQLPKPALEEHWKTWTYREYYDDCLIAAKGFIKCGLEVHHSVCILGFNTPNWLIANMAAIMAGGLSVGIYLKSTPEVCLDITKQTQANIVVVQVTKDAVQLNKILKVVSSMTHLKALVYFGGSIKNKPAGICCIEWKELMDIGKTADGSLLKQRMANLHPLGCCSVIYTTDFETFHHPQGVMLSHDNITWSCKRFIEAAKCESGKEAVVSYLPLSNITSQMIDIYAMIASGGSCWCSPVEESLLNVLAEVRPTIFLGFPREWESIREYLEVATAKMKGLGLKDIICSRLQVNNSALLNRLKAKWKGYTLNRTVDRVFRKKIVRSIGLDRCHLLLSGFAPISRTTLAYLNLLKLTVCELYGMAETTGPLIISDKDFVYLACGAPYRGTQVRFNPHCDEELLITSRQVFMGYLGDTEATTSIFYKRSWIRTGDSGFQSADGKVAITGRVNDMIVLTSGVKVAPVPLEHAVLKVLSIIANQAVVIGDGRQYLVCLITLKTILDMDTMRRTDIFEPAVQSVLIEHGCTATCLRGIKDGENRKIMDRLMAEAVLKVNKQETRHSHMIKRIQFLETPSRLSDIALTYEDTVQWRRLYVMENFGTTIDDLYHEEVFDLTKAVENLKLPSKRGSGRKRD